MLRATIWLIERLKEWESPEFYLTLTGSAKFLLSRFRYRMGKMSNTH
jgi:hypothetical protein